MQFAYHGVELNGFDHLYNLTHLNERRIELAIAHHWLSERGDMMGGLEVGNVLGHYHRCEHTVIDRYEPPAWYQAGHQPVHAIDVLDYIEDVNEHQGTHPGWPWIVSISTIEHIGEHPPRDDRDCLRALRGMQQLLGPGGSMLVTFPLGVSESLDVFWAVGAKSCSRSAVYTREDRDDGTWWTEGMRAKTRRPAGTEHVFVGEWEAER